MKYFSINELCESSTAKSLKISNLPDAEAKKHLTELVNNILDPLREAWGSGIKVSSGYRSPKVNKAVGGSTTSSHCQGYAADLLPANGKMAEFKAFVKKWLVEKSKGFDQYINEYSGAKEWVHIGYKNSKGQQRKQLLMYKGGVYTHIK